MIREEQQIAILEMYAMGMFKREISRKLGVSRKTVRSVLRKGVQTEKWKPEDEDLELIRQLFKSCKGNVVRVQEIMEQEHGRSRAYSTLTKLVREDHLRDPKPRAGHYSFQPGEEMQHDTWAPVRAPYASGAATAA